MGQLFNTIRQLVTAEAYVIGLHASERLEERGILEWQAVVGMEEGKLVAEMPDTLPHPTVEVQCYLSDGTEFRAIWSLLSKSQVAKLVTVFFLDS